MELKMCCAVGTLSGCSNVQAALKWFYKCIFIYLGSIPAFTFSYSYDIPISFVVVGRHDLAFPFYFYGLLELGGKSIPFC
jgi:hypothetical protein